tara:strand:+ start:2687 stop:3094 length:408 start_codon:yes stop_codon:yes gene_type:complete
MDVKMKSFVQFECKEHLLLIINRNDTYPTLNKICLNCDLSSINFTQSVKNIKKGKPLKIENVCFNFFINDKEYFNEFHFFEIKSKNESYIFSFELERYKIDLEIDKYSLNENNEFVLKNALVNTTMIRLGKINEI